MTNQASDAVDWIRMRKARPFNQIFPSTRRWFESLPASARPIEMMKEYPRVSNRIAVAWPDPSAAKEVLDDLLVDRRGNRQGLPSFVTIEVMRLLDLLGRANASLVRP